MIMPGAILLLIFSYGPMFGIIMSFQKFNPIKGFLGSPWVGLTNFNYMLNLPNIYEVVRNTLFIAIMKIAIGMLIPVIVALMLNESRNAFAKRTIQSLIYLPHFLSWAILSGVIIDILSPSSGIINQLITAAGFKPIYFLGNEHIFPYVLVLTESWKEFGFGTIIYLAALTSIDPTLYEAAVVDGANRWKQTLYITIPGLATTIVLMATLSLGNILNAGFEQVFILYSPQVYSTGDILDTLVYRLGLVDLQYSVATAVGLFKSVVSFLMITIAYRLAARYANYRIF